MVDGGCDGAKVRPKVLKVRGAVVWGRVQNMDREVLLMIAGAGGFALGVLFAVGLAVSLYVKYRHPPDSLRHSTSASLSSSAGRPS